MARGRALTAIGAVALAVVIAGPAAAHVHEFNNVVSISFAQEDPASGDGNYRGDITSPKDKCKRRREVQVFDAVTGNRLARGRSNAVGSWKASGTPAPVGNKVYALIETKVLSDPDHTCKVNRSAKRAFPYP